VYKRQLIFLTIFLLLVLLTIQTVVTFEFSSLSSSSNLKEYAIKNGSDELTFYKNYEYFLAGSIVIPKYIVVSCLIYLSEQASFYLGFNSLFIFIYIKLLIYVSCGFISFQYLQKIVSPAHLKIFFAYYFFNYPIFIYRFSILRDDLNVAVIFMLACFLFNKFTYNDLRLLFWLKLVLILILSFFIKPEITLVITSFITFMFIMKFRLKSLPLVCLLLCFAFYIVLNNNKFLNLFFALGGISFDPYYILNAYRVHYFSPFPSSMFDFMYSELITWPGKSYIWYLISVPLYFMMFLQCIYKLSSHKFKCCYYNKYFLCIFFFLPLYISFIYGAFSPDMKFLGPRQGLPLANLLLFYLLPYSMEFIRKLKQE
jgi:hypothetical protein